jgi:hypothetical protein
MNGTYAHSADAPVPLDRIADVIYRSFDSALPQQCADRHSIAVTVTCPEEGLPMTLRVQCEDLFAMNIRVAVEHVGGNVYDVFCTTEEGASCQLTYGCPEDTGSPLPLCPRLGEKFADFVLDELEQRLGRWHLRKEEE